LAQGNIKEQNKTAPDPSLSLVFVWWNIFEINPFYQKWADTVLGVGRADAVGAAVAVAVRNRVPSQRGMT